MKNPESVSLCFWNDSNTEHWEVGGLLSDFICIIKDFEETDIQYFLKESAYGTAIIW